MTDYINHADESMWSLSMIESEAGLVAIEATCQDETINLSNWTVVKSKQNEMVVLHEGTQTRVTLAKVGDVWWVHQSGIVSKVEVIEKGSVSTFDQMGGLTSPMPGKVLTVMVEVGEKVDEGQALLILEAMKMENRICSPVDGVVSSVNFQAGEQVDQGSVLIEIDSDE